MTTTAPEFTATTVVRRAPDAHEVEVVGRPYPAISGSGAPASHAETVAVLISRRQWWIDLAVSVMAMINVGSADSVFDVREALAQADLWAPEGMSQTAVTITLRGAQS